ncbi:MULTISPECIES: cache domain-containing sensor histidine kinase [unclassified Paenibacillus]|uniref:cache domain-containing sensor histidine kinase n=1 Tax=unclassified Paenibacillus TaxID=185978 RepID=UPI0009A86A58|nr:MULTISPECIES: histidine kinase [unclassified Paenibacillus]SLK07642.1 two-component system, sensor histidine kinase YesM [Paenibacillus sp. RU5A]SOC73170.1 two-component system, sensor histidine kinase YesM [Paenibacillus sp. RU5M]
MSRIKNAFTTLPIHHKTILLIGLLMMISFTFYVSVLGYVFGIYDRQIYEKSSQVLNMSSVGIENQLREISNLSFKVMSDEPLQQYLLQLDKAESGYEKNGLRKKITNRLVAYEGSEKYVYSMIFIDNDNNIMAAGNREGISEKKQRELVALGQQYSGSNAWYTGGDQQARLLSVRQVKSFTGGAFTLEKLGTLVIRVRLDRIVQDQMQHPAEDSQLLITDGREVIYPTESTVSKSEIESELKRTQPYGIAMFEQGRNFVARANSPYTDWVYLYMTPFDQMFKQIQFVKQLVTVIFIMIFLAALIFGAKFSRSITQPIAQLIKKMRNIEKGDLDKLEEVALGNVPVSSQNEVGLLHRTFKMMVQRIRELIDENYAKQLVIRETELKALQAQINPHFLYNTLESINWLAKVQKQHQISEMVEALGFLLRSSVNMSEKWITLERELDIVRSYVTIQHTRFEERLDFDMDIAPEVGTARIPKLTLQPLVENAIHYALEPSIEPCRIRIRARADGDNVVIEVEDDGPGMTPEFLEQLQEGRVQTRGQGIGLSNIKERIRLTFGEEGEMIMSSNPGSGTVVSIRIPWVREDDDDVQSDARR